MIIIIYNSLQPIKEGAKAKETKKFKLTDEDRNLASDVKKLNMLDWLNENDRGIDIDIWLKKDVCVTLEDLNLIFITDYTRGLSTILSNNILDTNNTPFRAFSHKIKQLYIFQKNKWKKSTKKDIIKIFDRLQLNILKRSKDYDNSLSHNERYGVDNIQYLKNTQKIMIVDTKKRERYYKYIEKSIIDLTKKNLNDMAKFKFYL